MTHEEKLLEDYLNGERDNLPPEVWKHIATCKECQALLEVHHRFIEAARTPMVPDALSEERRFLMRIQKMSPWRRWVAWGGVVTAAATLLLMLGQPRPHLSFRQPIVPIQPTSIPVLVYPEDGKVLPNGRLTLIIQSIQPGVNLLSVEVDDQPMAAWLQKQEDTWSLEDFYLPETGPHEIRIRLQAGQDTLEIERIVYTGGFQL